MKKKATMRNEQGFTILEVLAASTVLTVILGGIFSLYSANLKTTAVTMKYMGVSLQNQKALQLMAEELMGTDVDHSNLAMGTKDGTRTFEEFRPDKTNLAVDLHESITFRRISGFDPDTGQQIWSEPITYRLNAKTREIERIEGNQRTVLASKASGLSFFRAGGRVGVVFKTYDPETKVTVENWFEVSPRNIGQATEATIALK